MVARNTKIPTATEPGPTECLLCWRHCAQYSICRVSHGPYSRLDHTKLPVFHFLGEPIKMVTSDGTAYTSACSCRRGRQQLLNTQLHGWWVTSVSHNVPKLGHPRSGHHGTGPRGPTPHAWSLYYTAKAMLKSRTQ